LHKFLYLTQKLTLTRLNLLCKCHTCGICLLAQVEMSVFTKTTGPHPACQLMGTGGCLPGIKQSAHDTRHSLQSSASVMNMWICTFTPTYASLTCCLFIHINSFRFTYWMTNQYLNIPHPRRSLFNEWTAIKNRMFYIRVSTVSFLDSAVFNWSYMSEFSDVSNRPTVLTFDMFFRNFTKFLTNCMASHFRIHYYLFASVKTSCFTF
jgi:hypothetical protein